MRFFTHFLVIALAIFALTSARRPKYRQEEDSAEEYEPKNNRNSRRYSVSNSRRFSTQAPSRSKYQEDEYEEEEESAEFSLADVSKIPYGQSLRLQQKGIDGTTNVKYNYMGKSYSSSFELARYLAVAAYRTACTNAEMKGDSAKRCWQCVEKIVSVPAAENDDWNTYQIQPVITQCSNRYLLNTAYETCIAKISDDVLKRNEDDYYITLPWSSPDIKSFQDQGYISTPSYDYFPWFLPTLNYYRCSHSILNRKDKGQCGDDAKCIASLFTKSMSTVVKEPSWTRLAPIPLEQRTKGYDAKLQKSELKQHNKLRALHGVPPLELDDDLIVWAQNYANYLASKQLTEHNPKNQIVGYGENLSYGFGIPYSYNGSSTQQWYDEINVYDFKNPQWVGLWDRKRMNGHFTQVVWKETTKVGFGIAAFPDGTGILVGNYDPPGNRAVSPEQVSRAVGAKNLRASVLQLCSVEKHEGC